MVLIMNITSKRTKIILKALADKHFAEWCSHYGEPGYNDPDAGVILCNWNNISKEVANYLEKAGFELEWSDEWVIDYDHDKAYRTSPDSYGWRPTAVYSYDGDLLTPEDDAGDVIDEFATEQFNQVKSVPHWVTDDDLETAGFVKHNGEFESGHHPGQTDNPQTIGNELLKTIARRVVARVDDNGQFDCRFSMWYEPNAG